MRIQDLKKNQIFLVSVICVLFYSFQGTENGTIQNFLKDIKENIITNDMIIHKHIQLNDKNTHELKSEKEMLSKIIDEYRDDLKNRDLKSLNLRKYGEIKDSLVFNLNDRQKDYYRAVVDKDTVVYRLLLNKNNKLISISVMQKGKTGIFLEF